jgi:glycine amidinotransferase
MALSRRVVNSHNEWDVLEEVIVGVLDGAAYEAWEPAFYGALKPEERDRAREAQYRQAGKLREVPEETRRELQGFVDVLEREGVVVRRPAPLEHDCAFATPDWTVPAGTGQTCPRDSLIVIGDEILEAPMSYRSRFFEYRAYRPLLHEYFRAGAKWTAAPKPLMTPELYADVYGTEPGTSWATTEFEPVFDAADIARCGKDLFVQRSHVTNEAGIEWLRRHFTDYRVHRIEFHDARAVHIDATWVPLAPGRVLVNPDRPVKQQPDILRNSGWEFLESPRTTGAVGSGARWLLMNVLMLDPERVIVEKSETTLIRALEDWGFKPIPIPFRHCYAFGGGFHCFTCDIRRRSTLESYVPA